MKMLAMKFGLAVTLTFLSFTFAQAAFITDPGDIPGPQTIIDFSQFTGFNSGAGPLDIGEDVTLTGQFWYGSFSYSLGYMLSDPQNGYWYAPNNYVASGEVGVYSGNMTFSFNSGPVQAVGAFVNYYPGEGNPVIGVYDSDDNLLESYSIAPISTPSQENGGAFRGIVRDQADIAYFTYTGGMEVLTDLTFTQPLHAPIPGAAWLLGSGLLGLISFRRKIMTR